MPKTYRRASDAIRATMKRRNLSVNWIKSKLGRTGGGFHTQFKQGHAVKFVDDCLRALGLEVVDPSDTNTKEK